MVVLGRRVPLSQVLLADVPVEFVAAAEQQAAGHALQRHGEPPFRRGTRPPGVSGTARPAIDAGPLARALWCRREGAGGGCRGRSARRPWPGWAGLGPRRRRRLVPAGGNDAAPVAAGGGVDLYLFA